MNRKEVSTLVKVDLKSHTLSALQHDSRWSHLSRVPSSRLPVTYTGCYIRHISHVIYEYRRNDDPFQLRPDGFPAMKGAIIARTEVCC